RLHFGGLDVAHPTRQGGPEQLPLVDDGLAFKVPVPRKRHSDLCADAGSLRLTRAVQDARARGRHNVRRLIAERRGQLAVLSLNSLGRQMLLGLAGLMRRDLSGPGTVLPLLVEIRLNLMTPRT